MAIRKITFENPVNVSTQVGDSIYAILPGVTSVGANNLAGVITSIPSAKQINYDDATGLVVASDGDFIMFQKNNQVNVSSLSGYYAEVKLENLSSDKAELFSLGSEITISSK